METRVHHGKGRWRVAGVVALLAVVGAVVGVNVAASARNATSPGKSKHGPPYTIVMSNNFLGNDFRPQAENLFKVASKYGPFKGKIKPVVVNAGSTVTAHIASLNNIIQTKPDAIILYVSSETALDPVLTRACKAGIVVVTISGRADAPCAYNVTADYFKGAYNMGRWMAQALKGKGSVFVDNGLVGLGIAAQIKSGFVAGLKKDGPAIKIAGTYTGSFALGPEQSGISNLLVAHPDVSGIHTQGYCSPAFNALKSAGKNPVPTTCYSYNGEMKACDVPGRECALQSGDAVYVEDAMQIALTVLEGQPVYLNAQPGKVISVVPDLFVTSRPKVSIPGVKLIPLTKKVYFPSSPPGFSVPYTRADIPFPVSLAVPKK